MKRVEMMRHKVQNCSADIVHFFVRIKYLSTSMVIGDTARIRTDLIEQFGFHSR